MIWLGIRSDRLTERSATGSIESRLRVELVRKSIHLLVALVPMIASYSVALAVGMLAAGTVIYVSAESLRRAGVRVALISDLTVIASRDRDHGGFVLGPVTLGLGAMLALMLYPEPAAAIGIYALAFGDGLASVVGTVVKSARIPLTGGKTVAGSAACLVAVVIAAYAVSGNPTAAIGIGLIATSLEMAPTGDADNLVLPVGVGLASLIIL